MLKSDEENRSVQTPVAIWATVGAEPPVGALTSDPVENTPGETNVAVVKLAGICEARATGAVTHVESDLKNAPRLLAVLKSLPASRSTSNAVTIALREAVLTLTEPIVGLIWPEPEPTVRRPPGAEAAVEGMAPPK